MLRYKTETRPGLVALYDIWPGNGAGQFLQPRSPHRATSPALYHTANQPSQLLVLCNCIFQLSCIMWVKIGLRQTVIPATRVRCPPAVKPTRP